ATDRQHLFGRIQALDGEAIARQRHQQATGPTRNFQRHATIVTDAIVKKGLVPEGLVTEPQIVALGCESTVVPIRLAHDDIHVAPVSALSLTTGAPLAS